MLDLQSQHSRDVKLLQKQLNILEVTGTECCVL
jgi:hypothetical protein